MEDTWQHLRVEKIAGCRLEDHISSVPADVRAEALAGAGRPAWPEALQCAVAGCQIPDPRSQTQDLHHYDQTDFYNSILQ